jgi:hypothetical protein
MKPIEINKTTGIFFLCPHPSPKKSSKTWSVLKFSPYVLFLKNILAIKRVVKNFRTLHVFDNYFGEGGGGIKKNFQLVDIETNIFESTFWLNNANR